MGKKRHLTLGELVQLIRRDVQLRVRKTEKRNDRLSRVTSDDRDGELGGIALARDRGDEGLSADDVQGGDAEQSLGIEGAGGFEHLGCNRDGGVDRVGDDEYVGFRSVLGHALDEISDDAGVDLEQVVAGHAGLAFCN